MKLVLIAMIHRTEEKPFDRSVTEHQHLNGWLIFTWTTRSFSCFTFRLDLGEFSYFLLYTVRRVVESHGNLIVKSRGNVVDLVRNWLRGN